MITAGVLLPAFGGWCLTFLMERSLKPRPRLLGRAAGAHAIHLGTWLALFGGLLVVVRRPVLAMALAVLAWLPVVLVSNAKFNSLREPLVVTDLPFVTDAFRHPRLYVPFLGASRILLFAGALVGAVVGWQYLMRAWPVPHDWPGVLPVAAAFGGPAVVLLWFGSRFCTAPTFDAALDLQQWGLAASFWLYRRADTRSPVPVPHSPMMSRMGRVAATSRPDIVVVQSESFFDARRLFPIARRDVLDAFDALRLSAVAEGRLRVPAWGANTVRTEFSFLSGLASERLGVDRLNPYRALALRGVPTIATYLRDLGYRTVCVHPYPSTFYRRDRVFPGLGFDQFMDLESFRDAATFGPYVSDSAVTAKIISTMGESERPTFVFAITMENHGPLHLEALAPGEAAEYCTAPGSGEEPPHDLVVYLRHLKNADRMIAGLRTWGASRPRETVLCFYGDHVPIMPAVYETAREYDGCSDYVVWSSEVSRGATCGIPRAGVPDGRPDDLPVEKLGVLLLEAAGLMDYDAVELRREPSRMK